MDEKSLIEQKTQLEWQRDAELRACGSKWRRRIGYVELLVKAKATADNITSQTKPGQGSQIAVFVDDLHAKVKQDRKECVLEVLRQALEDNLGFLTARELVEQINSTNPFLVTEQDINNCWEFPF